MTGAGFYWLGATTHPTAEWIARQLTEACGWDEAPRYLIRDRDRSYGEVFVRRVRAMGIRDRPTSPRSPWQNGYAERLIGSIRRECIDHVIVFGGHLHHLLRCYLATTMRRVRTCPWTRMGRFPAPFSLLASYSAVRSLADCITNMCESNLRQAQARKAGVERLVHISGIGADAQLPSPYIRARGRGEQVVRAIFGGATVIRPAVLFGLDDTFLNTLIKLMRRLPIYPMFGRGETRLQPTDVEDVAGWSHAGPWRPRGRCGLFFLGFSVGQLVGAARVAPRRGVSCGRGAGDGCDGETDRGTSPILGGRTGPTPWRS